MLFEPAEQDTLVLPIGQVAGNTNIIVLVSIFGFFATLAVTLRLFTRRCLIRSLGWDDYVMILSLVFFIIYDFAFIMASMYVAGQSTVTLRHFKDAIVYMLVAEHFYTITVITLKLSLGLFFLRIMTFQWQRWVVYGAMVLSTVVGLLYFFVSVFQCGYFSNIWIFLERRITLQGCIKQHDALAIAYTQSAVSATVDWVYALLPLFLLKNLQMKRREKYILGGILSLATVGSIASLVRFKYIPVLVENTDVFFPHSVKIAAWSLVEIGLGIIAGCLATLRPLFRKFFTLLPLSTLNSGASRSNHKDSKFTDRSNVTQNSEFHHGYEEHALGRVSMEAVDEERIEKFMTKR